MTDKNVLEWLKETRTWKVIVQALKDGYYGLAFPRDDDELRLAQYGVSIATLGTFSLLILSFFWTMSRDLGVSLTSETLFRFFNPSFFLILSGLLKVVQSLSKSKTGSQILAFLSGLFLILGLVFFVALIVLLILGSALLVKSV